MRVVGDVIRLNAKRFPKAKALVTESEYLTFSDLNTKVNQLAHGLISAGMKPGDRIAILGFNSIEWVIVYFAVAKVGGIAVPVNFRYKKNELLYVMNHSQSKMLLFGPEFVSLVEEAKGEFNSAPILVAFGQESETGTATLRTMMEGQPSVEPAVSVGPDWPVNIIYTSGTTGTPKGALMSHGACVNTYIGMAVEGDVNYHEVALMNMPFFHTAGIHCNLAPVFLKGGTGVITGSGKFDPDKILDVVARYGVTMSHWVPTHLAILLNSGSIGRHDISSLKKIWYGSSPIPSQVLSGCIEQTKVDFYQWYGQTETLMVSILKPDDHFGERSQYTGREMFNYELRIVDDDGRDVEVGEVGEVISRQEGYGMIGYYGMEEASKSTIRDGWIRTGDLARSEENGYFTVVDRIKDVIISGAENIYPKEIEDVIGKHPAVKEVAVFGIPDDVWGESVCAAVVKKAGQTIDEDTIVSFCGDELSTYKKPKRVVFVDDLPRNASGKITKNALKEPFWTGRQKRV